MANPQQPRRPAEDPRPEWAQLYGEAFLLLVKFSQGVASVKDAMQDLFATAMADQKHKGQIHGNLGKLGVLRKVPKEAIAVALAKVPPLVEYGKFMADLIDHYLSHAAEVGHEIVGFSKDEARAIWASLERKRKADLAGADIIGFLTGSNVPICDHCPMWAWAVRVQAERRDTQTKVDEAIAAELGETPAAAETEPVDPRAAIEALIKQAEADQRAAIEGQDFETAIEVRERLKRLREQLEALDTPPPAPPIVEAQPDDPTRRIRPAEPPPEAAVEGLDETIEVCVAPGASPVLVRFFKRFSGGEIGAAEFVTKVADIRKLLAQ